jgi:predicted small secreted protein
MKKNTLVVLSVVIILSALLSACGGQGGSVDQAVENAVESTLFSVTEGEASLTEWVQSTCDKRPDGTCKLMGE